MCLSEETPTSREGRQPGEGFTMPYGGVERVIEANWEWMKAEGFRPWWTGPEQEEDKKASEALDKFGIGNVRWGDTYHEESERPLRHAPGVTIYVRDGKRAARPEQNGRSPEARS